jgi:recombinational DNA repair protein RecT
MFDIDNIVVCGLNDKQIKIVKKSINTNIIREDNIEKLSNLNYFMLIIDFSNYESKNILNFLKYYEYVDSGLSTVIMFDKQFSLPNSRYYKRFTDIENNLIELIDKSYSKAKLENNKIKNISYLLTILQSIEQGSISTLDLSKLISKNENTVKRYIEILKCNGYEIKYNFNIKVWFI